MTILDRYIARQFLFNTLVLLTLLFAFVVTIDVSLNLDRYVTTAVNHTQGQNPSGLRLGLVTIFAIADLWWPRLLQLFNFLLGLILAGAMGFTLTQLVRHRELVAVLASGVSLYRVARPIMLVAAAMMAVQAVNQELVIPRLAERGLLARDFRDALTHDWGAFEVRLVRDAAGNRYYAKSFDKTDGILENLHVWERDADGHALRRISAPRAVWIEPRDGAPGSWDLRHASVQPLTLAAPGSPGAEPSSDVWFQLKTDLDPTSLVIQRYASFSQSLSWSQIHAMLSTGVVDPDMRERLDRVRWGRISLFISGLLALLINLPFFLTREPRNMVVQSLKCAPVGIVTMMGAVLATAMSVPGLPAAFAVFLPVLILTPIAIATLSAMRT